MIEAIVGLAVEVGKTAFDLISNAITAKQEEQAAILAKLTAARDVLKGARTDTQAAHDKRTAETQAAIGVEPVKG